MDLSGPNEFEGFEERLIRHGWQARRLTPEGMLTERGGDEPLSLIYIGASVDNSQKTWLREWMPTASLLVADVPDVLSWPESRYISDNILAAPYSDETLNRQLQVVGSQARLDQDVVALLSFNLIGDSSCMQRLLRRIARVARYEAPVLIEGETGTGKEIVARSVHYASRRESSPFVSVNCGGMTDELLLSELFGHAKGAFTDARTHRKGLVNEAEGGTLFLDEVDSLSVKAQKSLLRFLQENEFRAVGSNVVECSDVRIVCATNRDLREVAEKGEFRQDLYYRLHVLELRVPALRERSEDIPQLVSHFLSRFSAEYQEPEKCLHPESLSWMQEYTWPGNVRQLENFLHRIFILNPGPMLCIPRNEIEQKEQSSEANRLPRISEGPFQEAKKRMMSYFEREYLRRVLSATSGNVSQAARLAGQDRRALSRLMKKHGVQRRQFS